MVVIKCKCKASPDMNVYSICMSTIFVALQSDYGMPTSPSDSSFPDSASIQASRSQLVELKVDLGLVTGGPSQGQEPRPPTPHELGVHLVRGSEVFRDNNPRGLIVTCVVPGSPAGKYLLRVIIHVLYCTFYCITNSYYQL